MAASSRPTLRRAVPQLLQIMRRFAPHLRVERVPIAGGMAALVAEVFLRLAEPFPLKLVIDHSLTTGTEPTGAIDRLGASGVAQLGPAGFAALMAVLTVVVVGLRALANYVATIGFALAGNRVLTKVRGDVYRHLQRLSLRFHDRARAGDLLTRLTGDVGRLQEVVVTAALPLLVNVVTFVGMVVVMLLISPPLTLLSMIALPLFVFTLSRLSGRISDAAKIQRRQEGELASFASEGLSAMQVVQAYALEPVLQRHFDKQAHGSLREGVRSKRLAAGLERRTDLLVGLATGLVLAAGAALVLRASLSVGDLVVFLSYLRSSFKPLRDTAKYTGRIAKATASGERIIDVLDTEPEIVDLPTAAPAPRLRGDVELDAVTFAYEDGHPVLRDVSLRAAPGERIAVVGPSGAGKSSVVALLPRLYEPQIGTVRIDGVDIRQYTLDSLRRQIALVLQDSVLFATTVRENIAFGAVDDVSDDEIVEAARLANADEFIRALPNGYDTEVGERGAMLSGGQRQRIAIARAAIRNAPIVLLDEPTTGLDAASERLVNEALARLCRGRTTFLIAHDLRTVRDATRIVLLDRGRVVEEGTHDELVAADGVYAAMYATQLRAARRRPRRGRSHAGTP